MQARNDADYRIVLAEESLALAHRDLQLQSWPTCVDFCQQTVENAAKAVLALVGPHPPTHGPGTLLKQRAQRGHFPQAVLPTVERLAKLSDDYGSDTHMRVRYGDEEARITPRGLFDEQSARDALAAAEEALRIGRDLLAALP